MIEMHVHADPDVRARCIDQLTLTRQCKQNGYRGIMYKCHDFITNDIAYLLRATVPGIEVFGGIALNRNYGDTVNVQAAKMATRVTGHYCRCIWMADLPVGVRHAEEGRRRAPCSTRRGRCCPRSSRSWKSAAGRRTSFSGHGALLSRRMRRAHRQGQGSGRQEGGRHAREPGPVEAVDGSGQGLYRPTARIWNTACCRTSRALMR